MQLDSGWKPRRLLLLDFQIAKCRQESLSDWKLQKINGRSTRSLSIEPRVIFPGLFLNFNLNTNSGVAHAFMSLVQSSVKKPVGLWDSSPHITDFQGSGWQRKDFITCLMFLWEWRWEIDWRAVNATLVSFNSDRDDSRRNSCSLSTTRVYRFRKRNRSIRQWRWQCKQTPSSLQVTKRSLHVDLTPAGGAVEHRLCSGRLLVLRGWLHHLC